MAIRVKRKTPVAVVAGMALTIGKGLSLRVKRKGVPRIIRNSGYAEWTGRANGGTHGLNAPPDWVLGTRIDYAGDCPAFWANKANNRSLYDVALVYIMLAIRHRDCMPPELLEAIDYYLDFTPLPASDPKDGPLRPMIEEWAKRSPTARERALANGDTDHD